MNRTKKIIIWTFVALAVLAAGYFVWTKLFSTGISIPKFIGNQTNNRQTSSTDVENTTNSSTVQLDPGKQSLAVFSRYFIEKVGSFSSDTNNLSLLEVKNLMGGQLFNQLNAELQQELKSNSQAFYGKTTKVATNEMTEYGPDTRAHFKASLNIQITKGNDQEQVQKTAEITFLKQDGDWKAVEMAVY